MQDPDIILKGGSVIDGTGSPPVRADVAITGNRISTVGNLKEGRARQVIDVHGLTVTPGFIDVHTHDDFAVLQTPEMPFKITQGVTTIIAGNCGLSAAPFVPCDGLPAPFTINLGSKDGAFETVAEYREAVDTRSPAVNVALLAGHSSLRANVMKTDLDRPARADELATMSAQLEQALSEGALGLSSGLDYPPALEAPMDELVALARIVARHPGAVYTSHMRDEADEVVAAVGETIETGARSGVPVVISHHKCAGIANFGKSVETLGLIETAQKQQKVGLDVYPYIASSSALIDRFLPAADDILVNWSEPHPEFGGRMLNDIAAGWNVSREEACRRLHPAGAIYFDMDEADLRRIMAFPTSMIGSDGIPGTEKPHPRLWGTFPRVLGHYAREEKVLDLALAVHKMTGLSAQTFNLKDRGIIVEGAIADIAVFDAETVIDAATFEDPEQPAKGIEHVLVGGRFALQAGQQTSERNGGFLARGQ